MTYGVFGVCVECVRVCVCLALAVAVRPSASSKVSVTRPTPSCVLVLITSVLACWFLIVHSARSGFRPVRTFAICRLRAVALSGQRWRCPEL